jgi:hypothetical protein
MSQENIEVVRGVRTPITVSTEARPRTLDERVLVRFPALARPLGFVWSRLPPRSRLRRAMNARLMRQAQEAAVRRDFELLFLRFDPEIEFEMAENPAFGFVAPDAVGVHRGREGYRRLSACDRGVGRPEIRTRRGRRLRRQAAHRWSYHRACEAHQDRPRCTPVSTRHRARWGGGAAAGLHGS